MAARCGDRDRLELDLANEQRDLLDLIGKLRSARLDNIRLPQIVVFGIQSAGKSYVLEAITGLPFPRDVGACTRFAVEIRLRRGDEKSFAVHIIPAKTRPSEDPVRRKDSGSALAQTTDFENLMRLATDLIAPQNIPGRFVTDDILVVKIKGPNEPMLTIVDLPGLVQVSNPKQSVDDIKAIEGLTDRYMRSSRTIIVAVVGGNEDYVQARVLLREHDPTGSRTIGVLTKPDLTKDLGLEQKFIDLVENKDPHNHFGLGWYVLRNPAPRKPGEKWLTPMERQKAEDEFFDDGLWSKLSKEVCGAAALKEQLSMQLLRHEENMS